jgi:hypothetical protein
LPAEVFGEAIARVGDLLFQLTWREGRAFLRNVADFSVMREITYEGEGWGLCYDGARIVAYCRPRLAARADPDRRGGLSSAAEHRCPSASVVQAEVYVARVQCPGSLRGPRVESGTHRRPAPGVDRRRGRGAVSPPAPGPNPPHPPQGLRDAGGGEPALAPLRAHPPHRALRALTGGDHPAASASGISRPSTMSRR